MKIFLFALFLFFISLFIFQPFFNLDFWGDDWLIFWINKYFHGSASSGQWSYIEHFFTMYGSQAILMDGLRSLFGMQPFYFYAASFILRLITAYSLYPLVSYLTKSKFSAIVASLFFAVTFTGIETSEYLPHMTSYIALTFFNFFIYFFIRAREEKKGKFLLISSILFFLTFVSAPIRMVGVIPFVFLLEMVGILKGSESLKSGLVRVSLIVLIFLSINIIGHPFWSVTEPQQKPNSAVFYPISNGLSVIQTEIKSQRYLVLFSPLVSFGNSFIPDVVIPDLRLLPSLLIAFIIFLIFSQTFTSSIPNIGSRFRKYLLLSGLLWTFFIAVVYSSYLSKDVPSKYIFSLLISGYILILGILLMIKFFSKRLIFDSLFISLTWPFFSLAVAWLYSPIAFIPSQQRYLIGSTISVSIFLATILTLAKNKRLLLIFFLIIFLSHMSATQKHWQVIEKTRNRDIGHKIWSAIPYFPEVGKGKYPDIFYFMDDGTSAVILHDIVTFGFPPHMDLLYNLNYLKGDLIPIPMSDVREVVSALKDGKSLKSYGYPTKPVPIENIYAFRLEGTDHLINITSQLKAVLSNIQD